MASHLEESLQRDINRIREKVREMAELAETGLQDALKAFVTNDRQLAFTVILRDQRIDELEKELDRLCLEFLIRQQPVASILRFIYVTIRMNLEMERVGDYAESIARQVVTLSAQTLNIDHSGFVEIGTVSIKMFHDAIEAFLAQDDASAHQLMLIEQKVDQMRQRLIANLLQLEMEGNLPLQALTPLMTIARRFERVSDQARNICQDILYICTGENLKHFGSDCYRVLFVDGPHGCLSRLAEQAGNSLKQKDFIFSSAGIHSTSWDRESLAVFAAANGLSLDASRSQMVQQVPNLDQYQVIVVLDEVSRAEYPPKPRRAAIFDWSSQFSDLRHGQDTPDKQTGIETYRKLLSLVTDLVSALGIKPSHSDKPVGIS